MDFTIPSTNCSTFFVTLAATLSCFLFGAALLIFRKVKLGPELKSKEEIETIGSGEDMTAQISSGVSGGNSGVSGISRENGNGGETALVAAVMPMLERQTGASMMEQLVPEITTHALSYLDYPSLCRLSMTNSLMRKAANDDNAWKALYHKDFTLEQDNMTPPNGWKAYYAATRAVVTVNAEFFRIIREKLLQAMGQFWLNADYVKCFHASGESFSGYNAVMESWQLAFTWEIVADFQVRDVRTRVLGDMAWVTMKAYIDMDAWAFIMTNIYEFHNGRWYMVHHHSSPLLIHGGAGQQLLHG